MGSKPSGISASRSSAILGLNPWSTELEVWQNIMEEQYPGYNAEHGYKLPEKKDNPALRWGLAFEDAIIRLAEDATKRDIINREGEYKYESYITCHIDGWFESHKIGDVNILTDDLHEGKTTSVWYYNDNFGDPGTDRVPVQYQSQCQHQLICTGAEQVILSVLVFPKRVEEWEESYTYLNTYVWAETLSQMGFFHQYIIPASFTTQKIMIEFYTEWWRKKIIEKQEPVAETYDDIKRLWTAPVGTIIAGDQLERWCREYRDLGEQLGSTSPLAKRRKQLKILILEKMRKMDGLVDDESRCKTVLRNKQGDKILSFDGGVMR